MLSRDWSEPKLILPADLIEDFTVTPDGPAFRAYYSRGPTLQDQRLYTRSMESPTGPYGSEVPVEPRTRTHTRIYRGRANSAQRFVTQVWPGLPKVGIWLHEAQAFGEVRRLVIPPTPGTLYSVAAANPCVRWDPRAGEFDLIFEGRAEPVFWRLFHARWSERDAFAQVDPEPLFDGANPSFLEWEEQLYLYFSRLTSRGWPGGFETCVVSQKIGIGR